MVRDGRGSAPPPAPAHPPAAAPPPAAPAPLPEPAPAPGARGRALPPPPARPASSWAPYAPGNGWNPAPDPAPAPTDTGPLEPLAPPPDGPSGAAPRRGPSTPVLLGALAAVAAVAAVVVVALLAAAGSQEVVIPAVRGQDLATANNVLQGLGLRTIIAAPVADAEVPEGSVVGTVPPAGTSLRPGEFVTLTASTGPEPIAVPGGVGLPESAARAALQEAGLTPGARVTESDDDVPAGEVLRAEPAPGTPVDAGGIVTLVVSAGPEPVVLPRVIGLTADDARRELEELGLTVETTAVAGDAGRVVDQVPDPGVSVQRGDSVVLVVGGA